MREPKSGLPGHDLISAGLGDLAAGRATEAALLVEMAAPRLRSLGLEVPESRSADPAPSHRPHALLAAAAPTRAPRGQDALSAAAARTSALKALASISSPSWRSMARRTFASRLALKSPRGSRSEAPWAKVSLTLSR